MHILSIIYKKYISVFKKSRIFACKSLVYMNRKQNEYLLKNISSDFIRISQLEQCANEIITNHKRGAIAELGVFRGDFAKYINAFFPDRKMYLFDTFEGFDDKDIVIDKKGKFSSAERVQDFSKTSEKLVLSKMENPEQCIIKKGWFPDSLEGLEETYIFVSIDTDLFKPVYEGLKYFWTHLEKGGYIFVHDYANDEYKGCKEAVLQFAQEEEIPFLPLVDLCGSAVFMK